MVPGHRNRATTVLSLLTRWTTSPNTLLNDGWRVRALTRNPSSDAAKELLRLGATAAVRRRLRNRRA
ncbi:NmrA family NAD(P)-binding protein [Arthrobacter sp. 754]|uniref:NmrA family NAD(P)-binding protein n=1 Tax=Arthrobacter sp. 754 TaxID=3156315 RepID=UPI003396E34F